MTPPFFLQRTLSQLRSRLRYGVAGATAAALSAALLISVAPPALGAPTSSAAAVGTFSLGTTTGGIDERTGKIRSNMPLSTLPGLASDGGSLSLTYSQDLVGQNRHGVGDGWSWAESFLDVNGADGIRVFTPSGEMFEADESNGVTGLKNHPLNDVKFRIESGVVKDPSGVRPDIEYSYSLTSMDSGTEYFDSEGNCLTRVDMRGKRFDMIRGENHELLGMVDDAGNRIEIRRTVDGNIEVLSPTREDGTVSKTVLELNGETLTGVINPIGDHTTFTYEDSGDFRGQLRSTTVENGAETTISYQTVARKDGSQAIAAKRVSVSDSRTGEVHSQREWSVTGDNHNASGFPDYADESELWGSGNNSYEYRTELTDGSTKLVSSFNAMGVLVNRQTFVKTSAGDYLSEEQRYGYPGTRGGGLPEVGAVPANYQMPTSVETTYREGDRSRTVFEESEYDDHGRVKKQRSADGTVTENVYDETIPAGRDLPIGLLLEQTTTGDDGTVSKTVNTLTDDHLAVAATETSVGAAGSAPTSVTSKSFVVQPDGFVSEERVSVKGDAGEGPGEVVSKFSREVGEKTVSITTTSAVGTSAETTSVDVTDKATGEAIRSIDPLGRVSSVSYDAGGRKTQTTDYAGKVTTFEYGDRFSRATQPDGVTTSQYVNAIGQLLKTTDNIRNGEVTPGFERVTETRRYDDNSSKVTVRNEQGIESTTTSDVKGRPLEVAGPTLKHVYEYDDIANTTREAIVASGETLQSARKVKTTTKDVESNRVTGVSSVRSDNVRVPESKTSYDGLGRVTSTVAGDVESTMELNPDGTTKKTTRSSVNNDFAGKPVTAERDYAGLLGASTRKTLSQDGSESRDGGSRVFDAEGRVVVEKDQEGAVIATITYTPDGLDDVVRNEKTGVTLRNSYDDTTRALVLSETTRDARDGVAAQTTRVAYSYDSAGRLSEMYDPNDREGTLVSYQYDAFGNITETRYPDGKAISHHYDEFGRKASTTDAAGNVTTFSYDKLGLLTRSAQKAADGSAIAGVDYKYDKYGRVTSITRDNGTVSTYTYTSVDTVASEKTTNKDGQTVFEGVYQYDDHGNVELARRTQPESAGSQNLVTTTTTYRYDMSNRLTESRVYSGTDATGTLAETNSYEFNVSNDVTRHVSVRGDVTSVRDFSYNKLGELTAITTDGVTQEQTFDEAGNLVRAADGTQYSYNASNTPVTTTNPDGSVAETSYWITGKRKTTATSGQPDTETLYWDGDTLMNETFASSEGMSTSAYLFGGTRLARSVDGEPASYYAKDRHGNVTATVGAAGIVDDTYSYSDYGVTTHTSRDAEVSVADRNPYQYSGELTGRDGRQLLGDRTYNPADGRFTTKDIASLHNVYAYGDGNPIMFVDPSGQTSTYDHTMAGLAIGGAVVGLIVAVAFGFSGAGLGVASTLIGQMSFLMGGVSLGMDALLAADKGMRTWAPPSDLGPVEGFLAPRTRQILEVTSGVLGGLTAVAGLGSLTQARKTYFNIGSKFNKPIKRAYEAAYLERYGAAATTDNRHWFVRGADWTWQRTKGLVRTAAGSIPGGDTIYKLVRDGLRRTFNIQKPLKKSGWMYENGVKMPMDKGLYLDKWAEAGRVGLPKGFNPLNPTKGSVIPNTNAPTALNETTPLLGGHGSDLNRAPGVVKKSSSSSSSTDDGVHEGLDPLFSGQNSKSPPSSASSSPRSSSSGSSWSDDGTIYLHLNDKF